MKGLKIILGIIYPILIILLLLSNCNRDKAGEGQENTEEDARTVKEEQVDTDTAQVDTAQAVREARNTGQTGNLKVTLLWDFYGDIDLHVMQPNGIVINFSNPQDAATGEALDVDNRQGGKGAAENIFWPNPPRGTYQVALHYFNNKNNSVPTSGICTVVVFLKGRPPKTYRVEMNHEGDLKKVVTINI